jgi:hypothetical protein
VHVAQAPGGDSSLSLAHGEGRSSEASRPSVHVAQAYNVKAYFASCSFGSRLVVAKDTAEGVVSSQRLLHFNRARRSSADSMRAFGSHIYAMYFNHAGYDGLDIDGTMHSALRYVQDILESAKKPVDNSELRSRKDLVRRIIADRCVALDCKLYLEILTRGRVLNHIDAFEDYFLFSSRSDFLTDSISTLFDLYLSRNNLDRVRSMMKNRSVKGASVKRSQKFWMNSSLQSVIERQFQRQKSRRQLGTSRVRFQLMDAHDGNQNILDATYATVSLRPYQILGADLRAIAALKASAVTIPNVIGEVFSIAGLHNKLKISYDVPWPISELFSESLMSTTAPITERLIELGHLISLKHFVWEYLRKDRTTRKNSSAEAREYYWSYCRIHQVSRMLFDFVVDRIRYNQIKFREEVSRSMHYGYRGLVASFGSYVSQLGESIFVSVEAGGYLEGQSAQLRVADVISRLLQLCRHSLLLNLLLSDESTIYKKSEVENVSIVDVRESIKISLYDCLKAVDELLEVLRKICNQSPDDLNSSVLVMYVDSVRNKSV